MKLKHPCGADAGDVSVRCAISYIDGSPLSLVEEDAIADAERRGVVHGDGSWVYESCYGGIAIDDAAELRPSPAREEKKKACAHSFLQRYSKFRTVGKPGVRRGGKVGG
jgi:hypothetical protein